jgi:hypothetical protein
MTEQGGQGEEGDLATLLLKGEKSEDPSKYIIFGSSKFNDYSKVNVLGKGTYGEVSRCIHIKSGTEIAMKTFFFDVLLSMNLTLNFRMCKTE